MTSHAKGKWKTSMKPVVWRFFRFTVDNEGEIGMSRVGTPLPTTKPGPVTMRPMVMRRAMPRVRPGARKVMKAMKVMKVMKASIVAKGKKAKVAVWQGKKLKTSGGLRKEHLVKSSKKKIVSAMRS